MNDVDNIRQAIADTITGTAGIIGSVKRPSVPGQGAAWPQLSSISRDGNNFLFRTWRVFVVLPQQEDAASTWFDEHVLEVLDAFRQRTLYIDSVEPGILAPSVSGQPPLFVMILTGRE